MSSDILKVVAAYELAQRNRIATAAHQRTRASAGVADDPISQLLQMEVHTERMLAREMARRVAEHPAWPWLERVRGVGPTLAARLLARLRIDRAHPILILEVLWPRHGGRCAIHLSELRRIGDARAGDRGATASSHTRRLRVHP